MEKTDNIIINSSSIWFFTLNHTLFAAHSSSHTLHHTLFVMHSPSHAHYYTLIITHSLVGIMAGRFSLSLLPLPHPNTHLI